MIHNKLVRDGIPDIIRADRKVPVTRILDQEEYISELTRKLVEEANEYTKEKSLEELADVLEVVRALATAHGSTHEDLEKLREAKAAKRGGFSQRIYLVEDKESHV